MILMIVHKFNFIVVNELKIYFAILTENCTPIIKSVQKGLIYKRTVKIRHIFSHKRFSQLKYCLTSSEILSVAKIYRLRKTLMCRTMYTI